MRGPTLTLSEFRRLTEHLSGDTYLTIDDGQGWYSNVELTQEAVEVYLDDDGTPSLILDSVGPVDTRQW